MVRPYNVEGVPQLAKDGGRHLVEVMEQLPYHLHLRGYKQAGRQKGPVQTGRVLFPYVMETKQPVPALTPPKFFL